MTAPIVAGGAVRQQDGQVDNVKIGHEVRESGRQAPGEGEDDLGHVVEVARHAPPAGGEEKAFVLGAVGSAVGGADQSGRTAPHGRVSVRGPHPLALGVGGVVDVDRADPEQENGRRERPGQVVRAQHEVLGGERIDRRDPGHDAPADIVAETVVHDVERGEVAAFPPEEPEQVNERERGGYQHRVAELPGGIQLSLFGGEGADDQAPAHHAEAAIDELLQVDAKEGGMQLDAPVVVPDEVAGETAILGSGPIAALEIKEEAEDQCEEDERGEDLAEMIPDDAGVEEVEAIGAAQEKSVGDEPGGDSIELVTGAVSGGCEGTFENPAGEPLEQDHLDHDEDEHNGGGAQARPGPMGGNGTPAGGSEQRREAAVERLEGADDPEDDGGGWSGENEAQGPQRGTNKLNQAALAASSPGGQLFGG